MKELVTIQVGDFANFVGSHLWNFQDELLGLAADPLSDAVFKNHGINMDVLYRSGETQKGIATHTPRLVSINFRGTLGSMSSRGSLYNEMSPLPSDVVSWNGNISTHASRPLKRNLFLQSLDEEEQEGFKSWNDDSGENLNSHGKYSDKDIVESLENEVQFWTDFSKVHYHPRSLYELSGVWMDVQEFDNYGAGRDAFSWTSQGDEISDRLRFFVEECDQIQGFQFIVDDSGGFSAIAADFLENIADDFANIPVMLYSVSGPSLHISSQSQKRTILRDLHEAVSFSRFSLYSKLLVPLGLPLLSESKASRLLQIKDEKAYHCSAIYAAAMYSTSLPFRMQPLSPASNSPHISGAIDVNSVVQMLTGQTWQNKVTILDVAMPAPPLKGYDNEQALLANLHPLTPGVVEDVEDFRAVESMTVHGVLDPEGKRASITEVKDAIDAAYKLAEWRPTFCHLSASLCPLPIPLPFPSIFRNSVGQQGELIGNTVSEFSPRGSLDVHSIPMAARLRSSKAVLPFLQCRMENLRKFGTDRGAAGVQLLRSWGFGKDDVDEMREVLSNLISPFDPQQVSSDSD